MNLHWIDWTIVTSLIVLMVLSVRVTRRYTRSVADYLAANRCAGKYLISIADTMALVGAITIIAHFEAYYSAGFTFLWWGMLGGVMFFVALSGWVQYRFRQTRALTMAQFLEMRYGKAFRVFFGIQAFIIGLIAFGIFPAVGGRFFIYFCGFPSYSVQVGPVTIDLTLAAVMAILLAISLYFTFAGGQIAVIVTDFIQGTFANIAFIAVMVFLLWKIPWDHLYETVITRGPGESMIDPFDTSKLRIFNVWFFVIHIILMIWYYMSYQGNQGYNSSALNAHEARMAKALGVWRMSMQGVPLVIVAVMAYVIMHSGRYEETAVRVITVLDGISTEPTNTIRTQVTTSVVMAKFLPVGLIGAMCAVVLASFISTHDTCLHSWGSILIQDVILPFRKTRLTPKRHLRWLKFSAAGIAVFVFVFSLFFNQYDALFMYMDLVSILGAGAGSVIVFGLYWKRGTTAAAVVSMLIGIIAFAIAFALQKYWLLVHGVPFPLNSRILMFICMIITIISYVAVSLTYRRSVFNMDKLLNRGAYAIKEDIVEVKNPPVKRWMAKIGITDEFRLRDKIIYFFFSTWQLCWFAFFAVIMIYRIFNDISDKIWSLYWKYNTWMNVVLAIITIFWFTWGGLLDLRTMFAKLAGKERDDTDDGEIVNNKTAVLD